MTNYEKGIKLLEIGKAYKHYSYNETGILYIILEGSFCGYIFPNKEYVEITLNNSVFAHGNIILGENIIMSSRNNRTWNIL